MELEEALKLVRRARPEVPCPKTRNLELGSLQPESLKPDTWHRKPGRAPSKANPWLESDFQGFFKNSVLLNTSWLCAAITWLCAQSWLCAAIRIEFGRCSFTWASQISSHTKVFLKSFCRSQLHHKSVHVSITVTNIEDKLTGLCRIYFNNTTLFCFDVRKNCDACGG